MKIFKALSVILAALILVSVFTGCHKQSPEDLFRKNTEHIRESSESPYLGKIKELVANSVGEYKEIVIEAYRSDNVPYIIAHVLMEGKYQKITVKFGDFQEMIVRSLIGEQLPSKTWEENLENYMNREFNCELNRDLLKIY